MDDVIDISTDRHCAAAGRRSVAAAMAAIASLSLVGCASNPPEQLGGPVADAPAVAAVQAASVQHVGKTVRWGGEILAVTNAAAHSDVEVYSRPLFDNAEPKPTGGDGVRFVARIDGFVDPVEYKPGKRLTVRGLVEPAINGKVGEYSYVFPLVAVDTMHLWPVYTPPPDPPWYRDPYWDPWWPGPWGPWGRWGHYRYWPYGW